VVKFKEIESAQKASQCEDPILGNPRIKIIYSTGPPVIPDPKEDLKKGEHTIITKSNNKLYESEELSKVRKL
jgi:hypothetical protein